MTLISRVQLYELLLELDLGVRFVLLGSVHGHNLREIGSFLLLPDLQHDAHDNVFEKVPPCAHVEFFVLVLNLGVVLEEVDWVLVFALEVAVLGNEHSG